jgi:hypothetical protein
MDLGASTWDAADLFLAVCPFLMAHFLRVIRETGRNIFDRFGKASRVSGTVFGCDLQAFLLHRYASARLKAPISVKHVPDRVGILCLITSFGNGRTMLCIINACLLADVSAIKLIRSLCSSRATIGGRPFA